MECEIHDFDTNSLDNAFADYSLEVDKSNAGKTLVKAVF